MNLLESITTYEAAITDPIYSYITLAVLVITGFLIIFIFRVQTEGEAERNTSESYRELMIAFGAGKQSSTEKLEISKKYWLFANDLLGTKGGAIILSKLRNKIYQILEEIYDEKSFFENFEEISPNSLNNETKRKVNLFLGNEKEKSYSFYYFERYKYYYEIYYSLRGRFKNRNERNEVFMKFDAYFNCLLVNETIRKELKKEIEKFYVFYLGWRRV